jgi:hypothetical protein
LSPPWLERVFVSPQTPTGPSVDKFPDFSHSLEGQDPYAVSPMLSDAGGRLSCNG